MWDHVDSTADHDILVFKMGFFAPGAKVRA